MFKNFHNSLNSLSISIQFTTASYTYNSQDAITPHTVTYW